VYLQVVGAFLHLIHCWRVSSSFLRSHPVQYPNLSFWLNPLSSHRIETVLAYPNWGRRCMRIVHTLVLSKQVHISNRLLFKSLRRLCVHSRLPHSNLAKMMLLTSFPAASACSIGESLPSGLFGKAGSGRFRWTIASCWAFIIFPNSCWLMSTRGSNSPRALTSPGGIGKTPAFSSSTAAPFTASMLSGLPGGPCTDCPASAEEATCGWPAPGGRPA
jgi:hypothetical protein